MYLCIYIYIYRYVYRGESLCNDSRYGFTVADTHTCPLWYYQVMDGYNYTSEIRDYIRCIMPFNICIYVYVYCI